MKTHYDNLKVAKNAPQEVIRAAYKTLCQKYHPDRNNNSEESVRIMKIINESYEVLSDPEKKKKHDEWIFRKENGEKEQISIEESNNQPAPDFVTPKSGAYAYKDLTNNEKEKLKNRIAGINKNQFSIQLAGARLNYLLAAILPGWFVYLFIDANEYRWPEETIYWHMALTGLVAIMLGHNISWIYRWKNTPLQSWLIVTPLYIVKTHLDMVWFWPIWTISDIKATHNYKNGSYQGTSLVIEFDGKKESFTISPKSAYESLLGAIKRYDGLFRNALSSKNISYLIENDDYVNTRQAGTAQATKQKIQKSTCLIYFIAIIVSAGLFFMSAEINFEKSYKPVFHAQTAPKYNPKPKSQPGYKKPILAPNGSPWPAGANYVSGYEKLETNGLSSVTVDNSQNDSDVFVKLVKINANESYPARVFYIPARSNFKVTNVAKGTYDIRYRDLDSGGLSKSESFVLEEIKTYNGVNFSEITMTLYKVRNGNMQTYGISENEF